MPLEAICKDCNKPYSYPAMEKHSQTGRCHACQHTHDLTQMNQELTSLQRRKQTVLPNVIKLNARKQLAKAAYDEALEDWERSAKLYAALDRKSALISHERDLLIGAKELAVKKAGKKPSRTPEQKAKAALKNLPADVQAAILAQFNQAEED